MSWTEEKVEKLKELWGKGNTASQIAEIIGGISRNAVIGKAHRLNLSAKIKTRSATSNQNFENKINIKNIKSRRGRKSKFKSLIIEKDFEPENPKQLDAVQAGNPFKLITQNQKANNIKITNIEEIVSLCCARP